MACRVEGSTVMTDLPSLLAARLRPAFAAVAGHDIDPALRRSDHADYQADAALGLARVLGRSPRQVAADVIAAADLDGLVTDAEVAGPGFINLTVDDAALSGLLPQLEDGRAGVAKAGSPKRVVVDYSGANVAKEMHVGHLRSTIIGDAITRVLDFLGHDVVRQNHVGDWGTQFGMLLEYLIDEGIDPAVNAYHVGDLNELYRKANDRFTGDTDFADRARRRVVALQSGDPRSVALWELLYDASKVHFNDIYGRLGILLTDDDLMGESAYNPMLAAVIDDLRAKELLVTSDGAECTFPPGYTGRDGTPLPLIVRKTDGGYGYATTDLAAVRYRFTDLAADRALYVIASGQHLHLSMVFDTATAAGWVADRDQVEHVQFGVVLGPDRKRLKSRSGETVRLVDLLDEAEQRAQSMVAERGGDLPADQQAEIAHAVAMGAVKYADLSNDRMRDYLLDFDQMLSMDGNTAPYLQYAHARIRSLFRRAGDQVSAEATSAPMSLGHPAEHTLAVRLLEFEGVVTRAGEDLELHKIAGYLFGLASDFTAFYEQCPILKDDIEPDVRGARLHLAALTAEVLRRGLGLLGIETPDRM
jgi:arginyl-tRNA synthetase